MVGFFIRRACRIFPPLVGLLLALVALDRLQVIHLNPESVLSSATFTCNVGFIDCQWWVAHTWSLAVEEQFYLAWPPILLLVPNRVLLLAGAIGLLLCAFFIHPLAWHSNYISFICIAMGALYASSERLRLVVATNANWAGLAVAVIFLIAGPLFLPPKLAQPVMPFAIVYLIFAARELPAARSAFTLPPIQIIAGASYSIYLWQQLFLAKPSLYAEPLSLWLFPIAVVGSVLLIERPFMRLGRVLSAKAAKRGRLPDPREGVVAALPTQHRSLPDR